jgi:glycosyltransferase involved in cell wall biosynthesis
VNQLLSIVVPVYNEAENAPSLIRDIDAEVSEPHEILIVYDFKEDNTLPAINAMNPPSPNVRCIENTIGRGVLNAYKAGFSACRGDVVILVAGDRADEPKDIPALAKLVREGADVACGSRYMKGGGQVGGPVFKQFLSRMAGLSLHYVAGLPTHDATNNFRAYSRRVIAMPIETKVSFALGIELVLKSHWNGWRIEERPTVWHDRREGVSRFRLWAWLPEYLRWYMQGIRHAWLPGGKKRT